LLQGRPDRWGAADVTSKAHLVLEGLDVWMSDEALPRSSEGKSFPACFSASPLSIVNCRGQAIRGQLFMGDITRAVNNLLIHGAGVSYPPWARGPHRLENNVLVGFGQVNITRRTEVQYSGSMDLDMRRNTIVGTIAVNAYLHGPLPD